MLSAKFMSGTDKYPAYTPGSGIKDFPDCAVILYGYTQKKHYKYKPGRQDDRRISIGNLPPKTWYCMCGLGEAATYEL